MAPGLGQEAVLADFDQAGLDRTVETLRGEGHQVDGHVVDVSSAPSVTDLADAAAATGSVVQVIHTAGLSPTQATADRILHVDLLGVAHVLDAFGTVVAPGGAGVVIASMAGSLTSGRLPAELESALALTPTDQLLDLPFWTDQAFASPGAAYGLAKRANQLRCRPRASRGVRGAPGSTASTPVSDPLVLRLIRLLLQRPIDGPGRMVGGWNVDVLSGQ